MAMSDSEVSQLDCRLRVTIDSIDA